MLILAWALGLRIPKTSATALLLAQNKPDPGPATVEQEDGILQAVIQSHILPGTGLNSQAETQLAASD